ncbi:MAG: GxxExxY protein [Candidatus Azambacteria bacterium]|nr:GxxExxY protein [Candidatus Azambacteria bacterium]
MNDNLKRKDLVYPDLCYQIIGILFDVYNNLGYGRSEKVYQRAVALGLKDSGLEFKEQFDQVYSYLVGSNLKLGILAYFAPRNIHFKRIVNL